MDDLLKEFSHIIADHDIRKDKEENGVYFFEVRIKFKDNTVLEAKERFFLAIKTRRYGYQWMKEDNSLIICWDNSPNHPEAGTHHQHIGSRQNVLPSEEMNLRKVLAFIAKTMAVVLILGYGLLYFLGEKSVEKVHKTQKFNSPHHIQTLHSNQFPIPQK
jgi:Family of unknown function (DUF6516)